MSDILDTERLSRSGFLDRLLKERRARLARIAAKAVDQRAPAPRPTFGIKGWQVPRRPAPKPRLMESRARPLAPAQAPEPAPPPLSLGARREYVTLIVDIVCRRYRCSANDLRSSSRRASIVKPRHMAIALCRELTGMSQPQLGCEFGRDHSTIRVSILKIRARIAADASLAREWDELLDRCRGAMR